jgi:hypothetical protein
VICSDPTAHPVLVVPHDSSGYEREGRPHDEEHCRDEQVVARRGVWGQGQHGEPPAVGVTGRLPGREPAEPTTHFGRTTMVRCSSGA